jgi:hypothetical protein
MAWMTLPFVIALDRAHLGERRFVELRAADRAAPELALQLLKPVRDVGHALLAGCSASSYRAAGDNPSS